jgi:outer membrane protein assembly factor BamD (BamD/ComL family)
MPARFVAALCLLLLSSPAAASPDGRSANELKDSASRAYLAGRVEEAAARWLELAESHPDSQAHAMAVQMLGTLYEEKLVDLGKAIAWDREFLERYANPRQAAFYREKLARLEGLQRQEGPFATYQSIRRAEQGDAAMVERLEALLTEHPNFSLRADVQRDLAYAYARLDQRRLSYERFTELARTTGAAFPSSDRLALEKAQRYWRLTAWGGGLAWCIVASLWIVALLARPWERITRASLTQFALWTAGWIALAAARLPSYYAAAWDENPFPPAAVYLVAGLNVAVLFWLLLLTNGRFWQTRPRALRWASPPLAILMTTAVLFLFAIHQPKGTEIIDAFGVKYRHWVREWQAPERAPAPGGGPSGTGVSGATGR